MDQGGPFLIYAQPALLLNFSDLFYVKMHYFEDNGRDDPIFWVFFLSKYFVIRSSILLILFDISVVSNKLYYALLST